ncbi:thymidine kinase [pteropodid alphaherpesvirus 2]|uniref:Thymidine kinase n=1 Tax=pteropodid alphaherpesvirus 2 TaxID=3118716 RepID=A0A510J6Z7_9ALPH|nr:thymidine kinase [pteropodid alphaherpesvirus 2]BBM13195.1 thymidine kinase [pteropodid alphaherpesvirus 2]
MLLRVYLDGPHGLGKTTLAKRLVENLSQFYEALFVPEPLQYWQSFGDQDAIARVYDTQRRFDQGELPASEAAMVMTSAQVTMTTPYAALHSLITPHIGYELIDSQAPPTSLALIFDRHPISSYLCYPLARYMMGSFSLHAVVSMLALLPPSIPGTNLILGNLPRDINAERLMERQRPGEILDLAMLKAIHDVFDRLANTIRYVRLGHSWSEEWSLLQPLTRNAALVAEVKKQEHPRIQDTLFALFCAPEMLDCKGQPSLILKWALDILADRALHFELTVIDYYQTPGACVDEIINVSEHLLSTTTTTYSSLQTLKDLVQRYNQELGQSE